MTASAIDNAVTPCRAVSGTQQQPRSTRYQTLSRKPPEAAHTSIDTLPGNRRPDDGSNLVRADAGGEVWARGTIHRRVLERRHGLQRRNRVLARRNGVRTAWMERAAWRRCDGARRFALYRRGLTA